MKATYIISLPPSRRRRRWTQKSRFDLSRWVAPALTLLIGLPLAGFTTFSLLGTLSSDNDDVVVASRLALPDMPDLSAPAPQLAAAQPLPAAILPSQAAPLVAVKEPLPAQPVAAMDANRRIIRVDRGDTLIGLLLEAAVPEAEAHSAMAALKGVYNPRDIRPGQDVTVLYDNGSFHGLEFEPSSEKAVRVERKGSDYKAAAIERPLTRQVMAASAVVESSLYEAGAKAGITQAAMAQMIKALSYNVDFQREINRGDSFKVLYETMRAPDGSLVRTGDLLYAEVNLGDRVIPVYRYTFRDGREEFYDRSGKSLRKALLRTPVDGARISSGFGMRRHPILGYSRMHRGIDFAAPTGTPIFAAGDGVVLERGWKSGFGNYIRIRHNGTLATAYAHMSRYHPSVVRGSRVRQGQVIGYVGSTGASTGPHLHFEVHINGAQVNPLKIRNMSVGEPLKGADLQRFKAMVDAIDHNFKGVDEGEVIPVAYNAPAVRGAGTARN